MKKSNSKKIKNFTIGSIASLSLIAPSVLPTVAYASEVEGLDKTNYQITNVSEDGNEVSMTFNFDELDESVDMTIKDLGNDNIEVNTITSSGESYNLTANRNNNFMVMNGEKINVEKEVTVEQQELKMSEKASRGAWDPVYVQTGKVQIGKTVTAIGAICTVIGGAIAIASLAGVSIASSAIASAVSNWSSAVGLGSLVAGYYFSGNITYKLYKTKSPVKPPTGTMKTAYRYQDVRAVGAVKGKNMNILLKSTGSWWW